MCHMSHLAAWCREDWDADDDAGCWGSLFPVDDAPSVQVNSWLADAPPDCRIQRRPGRQRWSSWPLPPPRTDATIPSGLATGAAFPARRPGFPVRRVAVTRFLGTTSHPKSADVSSQRSTTTRRWSPSVAGRPAPAGGRRICVRSGCWTACQRSRSRRPSADSEPSLTRGTPSQAPPPRPSAPCLHPRPR